MMTPEQEALAKKRFMALNLIRIFALILVVVGVLLAKDKIDVPAAHLIGIVLIAIGVVDFFLMPRFLVRRWKSPEA